MEISIQNIRLSNEWKNLLIPEFQKDSMKSLKKFLLEEKKSGKIIFPPSHAIFRAFDCIEPSHVKVVILGQDPYHGLGQAMGLCFSVPKEFKPLPPSLENIYKAVANDDPQFQHPGHGCLEGWAQQGVFLLNSVLTVEAHKPASHSQKGWEVFTDGVIQRLSQTYEHIVFLLWGSYAQKKEIFIDNNKHCVLKSVHPSPLSAYRGFLTCGHFLKANTYLIQHGKKPIHWSALS